MPTGVPSVLCLRRGYCDFSRYAKNGQFEKKMIFISKIFSPFPLSQFFNSQLCAMMPIYSAMLPGAVNLAAPPSEQSRVVLLVCFSFAPFRSELSAEVLIVISDETV